MGWPARYLHYPVLWATYQKTLIQILAVVADNATNNDTMMVELETLFCRIAIPFSAKLSRLQCTPHTVHLSAMKVGARFLYLYMLFFILSPASWWYWRHPFTICWSPSNTGQLPKVCFGTNCVLWGGATPCSNHWCWWWSISCAHIICPW